MINKKTTKSSSLKWNLQRRLEFIDYRLCWCGHINRSDLVKFFGISIPQSSLDLAEYISRAPNNLEYDRREKVYLRTKNFKPVFDICDPNRYLNEIYFVTSGCLSGAESYLEDIPSVACFVPPKKNVKLEVLSAIVYAIKNHQAIEITYSSMTHPEPHTRKIAPHAFGFDGVRWHVRAYCYNNEDFRDFVLSKITAVGQVFDSGVDSAEDVKWNLVVSICVVPNPKLTEAQKKSVELEYGMENGEVVFKCRQALLFYYLKTLRLDPKADDLSTDNHIVLKNKEQIALLLSL